MSQGDQKSPSGEDESLLLESQNSVPEIRPRIVGVVKKSASRRFTGAQDIARSMPLINGSGYIVRR